MAIPSTSDALELSFSVCHPTVPPPRLGYIPEWPRIHAHLSKVKGDHRACPAIKEREQLGITLFMPYTVRYFADGHFEVETPWTTGGPKWHSFTPTMELLGPDGEEGIFPGARIDLPEGPAFAAGLPMGFFTLGDLRLASWIFDSGVKLTGMPEGMVMLIAPPPYHEPPPGCYVGQAMATPRVGQRGLAIPIDFRPSRLPPGQECCVVERGTPICQYLPMWLPRITLRRED